MNLARLRDLGTRFSLSFLLVVASVSAAMSLGWLRPVEDAYDDLRFALLRRQPSQALTVVEIDAPSIRAAGRWPWPRDRFAAAIKNLEAAGATVVGFDVDFSLQSDAAADRRMADAISARPGTVILPTFVQAASRGGPLVETHPLQGLADNALIASVNVPIDPDGRARRYQSGFGGDDAYRQSMAAALAQTPGQPTGDFLIDYAVRPFDIPRLSFEAVFQNRFDKSKVAGKSVLIGARALELGDTFSTPPYGTVPGVYLHALAFEQLSAGRALHALHPAIRFALALGLIFLLRPTRRGATLRSQVRRHVIAAAAVLALPILIQAVSSVSLQAAPLILAQGLCILWATRTELARRAKAIVAEREAGLLHLALHEPETELPNRRALVNAIAAAVTPDSHAAVVTVGIDRYASIRAAVGYSLSNLIFRAVAKRLAEACPGAVVAHLSTSVLGVLVVSETAQGLSDDIARLEALDANYLVEGHPVDAHAKLGVAFAMGEEADAESLLEHAALALDLARRDDVALKVFDPGTLAETKVNLALMTDMEKGLLAGDQFELHYQPKWSTRGGEIASAEGLIRWRHPTQGNIRPDHFIVIAEETGRIRDLTLWTVERCLADAERLKASGRPMLLSVNISGRLIVDAPFCEAVLAMARGREKHLCLEITETALISNTELAQASIAAFREAGIKISIDDYGAGLSSLSYLKMINANELKLDRSLVLQVVESQRDRMILKSTVDLAHGLGMVVVAEGVETQDICSVLASLGCDLIQGWLIAKPMPLGDLIAFLDKREAEGMALSA